MKTKNFLLTFAFLVLSIFSFGQTGPQTLVKDLKILETQQVKVETSAPAIRPSGHLYVDDAGFLYVSDGVSWIVQFGATLTLQQVTDAGSITTNNIEALNFISTVVTGTAPFACTSTTLNANLNADLLDSQEGIYYLDLANATGTLSDLRLSSNVALKTIDNGFVGQTINGNVSIVTDNASLSVQGDNVKFLLQALNTSLGGYSRLRDNDNSEDAFRYYPNGRFELYYDGLNKLETTIIGAKTNGNHQTVGNVEVGGSLQVKLSDLNDQYYWDVDRNNLSGDLEIRTIQAGVIQPVALTIDAANNDVSLISTIVAPNVFKKATQTISGTTPTYNTSTSVNAKITLTGNTTMTLTNLVDGMSGNLKVDNGTGGFSLTISPTPKVINGGAGVVTLTGTASAVDIISWWYDGVDLNVTYGLNYN